MPSSDVLRGEVPCQTTFVEGFRVGSRAWTLGELGHYLEMT